MSYNIIKRSGSTIGYKRYENPFEDCQSCNKGYKTRELNNENYFFNPKGHLKINHKKLLASNSSKDCGSICTKKCPSTPCTKVHTSPCTKPCEIPCVEPCDPCHRPCKSECATKTSKCQPCVDPCDPCCRPYIVKCKSDDGCYTLDLCLDPPKCLHANRQFKKLYCELKQSIIYHRIDLLLKEINQDNYDEFVTVIMLVSSRINNGRIVVALPDGTVVVDTFKNNTWAGYQAKTINENHNTRVAFMDAQDKVGGVGYERKLSSTTGHYEKGVAVRLGEYLNNQGTIRLSAMFDELCDD